MGKSTVDWNSQETWQRVVAAIIATGVKIDYKQVALHFGTTYDTIENRFRKIKKEAIVLKEEVESGERGESMPARKTSTANCTPKTSPKKNPLTTVTNGRVSKTSTPKNRKSTIKQEAIGSDLDAPGDFDDGMGGYEHYTGTFNGDDLSLSDYLQ